MEEGKRGRLMNPDEFLDPDDRNLEQQLNDLGVEVIRVKKGGGDVGNNAISVKGENNEVKPIGTKEPAAPDHEEIMRQIEKKGLKGRISSTLTIENPKERVQELIDQGLTYGDIASKLGMGKSTFATLRQFYGVGRGRGRGVKATAKFDQVEPKRYVSKEEVADAFNVPVAMLQELELEQDIVITSKTIRTNAQAAGGEVLGTAKMLEKLGDLPVVVEIRVVEDLGE